MKVNPCNASNLMLFQISKTAVYTLRHKHFDNTTTYCVHNRKRISNRLELEIV